MTQSGQQTGRPFRNPRGAITPYRFKQDGPDGCGRFAFLYYNNGHTEREGYSAREVLWMALGRVAEGGGGDGGRIVIEWGQPEIVQYWRGDMANRPGWNAVSGEEQASLYSSGDCARCGVSSMEPRRVASHPGGATVGRRRPPVDPPLTPR